jgi:hypothetical protein
MHLHRFFTLFLMIAAPLFQPASSDPPPLPASPEVEADLSTAFTQRLLQISPGTGGLTFDLFTPEVDAAFLNPGGDIAVLWLALRDDYGLLLATEPGFALAYLTDEGWQVLLPGDPGWDETLAALPTGMVPLELSPVPDTIAEEPTVVIDTLTGYYLPYVAGTARKLEGSIGHFHDIPWLGYPSCSEETCRYAYDFTDAWHFPLLASKDALVVASRDSCSDGDTNCTNYIVLRDTNNLTYQLYLHLAHGTIPDKLTQGTTVRRGEYLGDTDDTGYSTSQHVHFMVTDGIWFGGDGYYWGRSVDIHFTDVAINSGVPRTCYEVTQLPIYDGATECLGSRSDPRNPNNDWFISGNAGAYPPTGGLTRPVAGATVAPGSNPLMDVTATASDDVNVTAVRLLAKIGGKWIELGPKVVQPVSPGVYDWDVDLCAVGPLNGPLEVALRAWDHEGNKSAVLSPRTIQVDHACPPPTSQLNPAVTFDSTAVRLSWDASTSGVPLGSFELQWRTEPGTWNSANIITFPASARSAWFVGNLGSSYAFRMRALDTNGQPEVWPAGGAAETNATLPATCTPDSSEPDDNPSQARFLALGALKHRNLCGPGNPDWYRIEVENAGIYFVSASSYNGGAAVRLTVFAEDGTTILASGQSPGIGQGIVLAFQPAVAGRYTIKVEPLLANLSGTKAVYGIVLSELSQIFLPLVVR